MQYFNSKNILLSITTAALLTITGCSSDSNSIANAVSNAYSGIGIDGILVGSTVCIDVDKSGTCDAGEPSAVTDALGKFSIAETTQTGPLLLVGGIDNSTGQAFTGTLKAPAGSSVVTPLTSAIQSLVESGKSAEDAEANVKAAMGLTNVDVNLTSFDPYNEVSANAQAVLAKQTQLQVLVHSAAVTLAGADANTDTNQTMNSVFDAIAANFDGVTAVVTLDAATVSAATKTAADAVYAANPSARVASKVVAVSAAESAVRDADSAESAITSGTQSEATANLDAAITKVNTTTETTLKAAAVDAKTNADTLSDAQIANIEVLQQAQQEKEAAVAAAQAAQAVADAELAAAKAAAVAAADDRVKYEAYLAAEAAAAQAAAEKAAADEAAALAAEAAAAQEKLIAAEAAQREAEAAAAAAQALAEKLEAELVAAAAAQAEADAKAAVDLAAAQAAAAQAAADAEALIVQAQVNTNNEIAKFIVTQMNSDLNSTKIAVVGITSSVIDANLTAAQSIYDTTTATLASLQSLVDTNSTDVNQSILYKDEIQASSTSLETILEAIYGEKANIELIAAAQIVLDAKIARIQLIESELITLNSNVTTRFNDFNATAVIDDLDAIGAIVTIYPDAQQAADDANASFSLADTAANIIGNQMTIISDAKIAAGTAVVDANETAALNAQSDAAAALVILEEQFVVLEAKAAEIAAIRVQAEAIRDAAIAAAIAATTGTDTFVNITTVYAVDSDENGNVKALKILLDNGVIREYYYDTNTSSWLDNNNTNSDLVLSSNGVWEPDNTSSYAVDPTTGIITLGNGSQKRLDAVVALPGSAVETEINLNIPSDTNISFVDGDLAYIVSSKFLETYVLNWKATNYSTGATFTTLEGFVNSGLFVAGTWDATGNYKGINLDVQLADTNVTTFSDGDGGDLVFENNVSDVVGSWGVVTLPNTSDLAIEFYPSTGNEALFGDYPANLIAIYNGEVYFGEHRLASPDFSQDDFPTFNEVAALRLLDFALSSSTTTTVADTNTTISLAGEWFDDNTTSSTTDMLLRLTSDGFFDTNESGELEYGSYSLAIGTIYDSNLSNPYADVDGNITFTKNSDTSDVNGLFRGTTSVTCSFGRFGDSLDLTCEGNVYNLVAQYTVDTNTTSTDVNATYRLEVNSATFGTTSYEEQALVRDANATTFSADTSSPAFTIAYTIDTNNTMNVVDVNGTLIMKAKILAQLNAATANSELNTTIFTNGVVYKTAFYNVDAKLESYGDTVYNPTGATYTTIDGYLTDYVTNRTPFANNELASNQGYVFEVANTTDMNGSVSIVDYADGSTIQSDAGYYTYDADKIIVFLNDDVSRGYHRAFVLDQGLGAVVYGDYTDPQSGGYGYFFDATALGEFVTFYDTNKDTLTNSVNFGIGKLDWATEFDSLTAIPFTAPLEVYDARINY